MSENADEPVPKLPRGRGIKLSRVEMIRIAFTAIALIGVIALAGPCAKAVSGFVTSFDDKPKGSAMPKPGKVDEPQHYETLKPGMSEQEVKDAIERSKARARGSAEVPAPTGSAGTAAPASPAPSK